MAKMHLKVTYTDGRVLESVRVTPRAEVAFEDRFNVGMSAAGDDMHMKYLYYLAWAALHYSGQEGKDFDAFIDVLDDVEMAKANADPTKPARPPDSSSS